MHHFQNLKIRLKAMDIAEQIYIISSEFPKEEKYGMTSQIMKSEVSIPSNIAERAGGNADDEFRDFLGIAWGSSNKPLTQFILSHPLNLISEDKIIL